MEISGLNNKSQSFFLLISVKMPTVVEILKCQQLLSFNIHEQSHARGFNTKTCPCNILQFFTAVKQISDGFLIFAQKFIVGTR